MENSSREQTQKEWCMTFLFARFCFVFIYNIYKRLLKRGGGMELETAISQCGDELTVGGLLTPCTAGSRKGKCIGVGCKMC